MDSSVRVLLEPQTLAYDAALRRQHEWVDWVHEASVRELDNVRGILMLGEHEPVYTLGRHGHLENMHMSSEALARLGIALVRTNRGGDITYHGPGQLVGYPILHLPSFNLGARAYIARIEETVIAMLRRFGISAFTDNSAPGVWLPSAAGKQLRKICAIGVHIGRSVSMHGFALNVSTDLENFARINPCGFTDRGVTSMALELGRDIAMDDVRLAFVECFAEHFDCSVEDSI